LRNCAETKRMTFFQRRGGIGLGKQVLAPFQKIEGPISCRKIPRIKAEEKVKKGKNATGARGLTSIKGARK